MKVWCGLMAYSRGCSEEFVGCWDGSCGDEVDRNLVVVVEIGGLYIYVYRLGTSDVSALREVVAAILKQQGKAPPSRA